MILMAKFFPECPDTLKNSSLPYDCFLTDLKNNSFCCLKDCCFITRRKKDIWQNWYFWIAIILFVLLILSTFLSYVTGLFKRKHHNLIRVRHLSARQNSSQPIITAISGSDGIIQPSIRYNTYSNKQQKNILLNDSLPKQNEQKSHLQSAKHLASPLTPPYTPIKPVTIIRGSAPPLGYRQTSTYTELVLPPGYIQTRNNLECDYLNPQECCLRLNACVTPRLGAQILLISLWFISGHWCLSLLNVPLLLWFIYERVTVPKTNNGVYDLLEIYNRNGVQKHMLKSLLNIIWLLIALSFNMYFAMQALLFDESSELPFKWNNTEY